MPPKSKADELYERIEKGEIETYFNNFNAEDFKALTYAMADDDMDGITELLLKNLKASKSGFETVLSGRFYDAEIRELANRILSRELKRKQKKPPKAKKRKENPKKKKKKKNTAKRFPPKRKNFFAVKKKKNSP